MHKVLAKVRAKEAGLLTPEFFYVERIEDAETVAAQAHRKFIPPVVVKPIGWGSSVGISIVGGYVTLLKTIQDLFNDGAGGVLVEELVRGREATAGIVEKLRGEAFYQLPITANGLSRVEVEDLKRAAKLIHRTLGLRHYSQSNFTVSPKGVYYLTTTSLPSLADDAYLPTSLASVGIRTSDFLSHLIDLARK